MKTAVRSAAVLAAATLASCGAAPEQAPQAAVTETPAAPAAVAQPAAPVKAPVAPAPVATAPASASGVATAPSVHAATVSYLAPSGNEDVGFSVTVGADGKISAVSVENKATNGISKRYQDGFSAAVPTAVIGKKVSDLGVDTIAGASLTTAAFVKYVRSF